MKVTLNWEIQVLFLEAEGTQRCSNNASGCQVHEPHPPFVQTVALRLSLDLGLTIASKFIQEEFKAIVDPDEEKHLLG